MMELARRTVLILEDELIIGLALEDMLAEAGATTLYAQSLANASGILARQEIDAAVLDINVHGEFSYAISEELMDRGIPFIFATGYGDVLHDPRFDKVPTVTKPYTFDDIARALRAAGLSDDG